MKNKSEGLKRRRQTKKDEQRRLSSFDSNSPEFARHKSVSTKKMEKIGSNPIILGDKESGASR